MPEYLLTYGQWWNEQIKMPPFCKVIAVGSSYLEKKSKEFPKKKNENIVIGVFSNPQNGKVLSEMVFKLQNYCMGRDIKILYKLHPNETKVWKQEYPLLGQMNNTEVISDNVSPFEIIAKSDILIGVNSTTFYEALIYDEIDMFIYNIGDIEGMRALIENGLAYSAESEKTIIFYLEEKSIKKEKGKIFPVEIWKENAAVNTKNIIADIIGLQK